MSYISDGYNVSKRFELETRDFSPYVECLQNNKSITMVNGLFRFADIIQRLLTAMEEENLHEEKYKITFSTLFHILANYDFLSGICKNDIECMRIENDILNGMYGKKVVEFYYDLNFQGKIRLLESIKKRKDAIGRNSYIFDILRIFMHSDLQFYSEMSDEFIIYIPMNSNDIHPFCKSMNNESVFNILKYLFFDVYQQFRVVWQVPMGIVDFDETMYIDNIQIY